MSRALDAGGRLSGGGVVVRSLAANGVECVFGIPGTHNLAIYDHLARFGVRHVTCRHEQGAGYAADGYARTSGRAGVVLTTSGPALLNAATAAAQSYSDSVPVLLVSPGMPLRQPRFAMGDLHETKDQSRAFDSIVAWSHRVTSADEIDSVIALAFDEFSSRRPRPVHLEIPFDLLEAEADISARPTVAPGSGRPRPSDLQLDSAAEALRGAERPALVLGGGARAAAAGCAELAELLQAPVVTSANGKGVVSETHHLSLGVALHLGCVQEWLAQRDVVLAIGTELASSDFWREPSPVGRCLIRLDIDPTQMVKGQRANVPLVGDAVDGVDGLLSRLRPRLGRRPESDLAAARSARVAEAEQLGARWLPYLQAIRQCLPAEAVITSDTAMACYYGALANLEVDTRGRYLHPTGLGTLGYSLPAAIGASRADPERPVVALSGDGGFQFTLQELGTAVDLGRSLPVIVFDNGGYGEIRSEMADRGSVPIAVDLRGPDLALLASAYGAVGRRTTTPEELRSALASALEYPGVTLLGVSEPSR